MNYSEVYHKIIHKAQSENRSKRTGIYESHHIVPKSLGGSNRKNNLVLLTLREHFICHLLLTRMYTGEDKSKMIWALHRLSFSRTLNSYQYEIARKMHVDNVSKPKSESTKKKMRKPKSDTHSKNISIGVTNDWRTRSRKRSSNATIKWTETINKRYPNGIFYGKNHSEETKQKISNSLKGNIPHNKGKLGKDSHWYGKKHTEETKRKMSEARKEYWRQKRNDQ